MGAPTLYRDNSVSAINSDAVSNEQSEVDRLAQSIDLFSPATIQSFGSEIADRTSAYTDSILKITRSAELQETGSQLNEIVLKAQEFDLDSLDNAFVRTPIIGGLLRRFSMTKEKMQARFDSVKTQVDKLVESVEKTADTLRARNTEFQQMYQTIQSEYDLLGLHVQAVEKRLVDFENEVASLSVQSDIRSAERVAVLEASGNLLRKRADDLKVLQHSAMQTLPMVRIIQSNNLLLIDKFTAIRQLTLPAWKRTFMLALTLEEQKNAAQLSDTIDEATNSMMRRNAELLHQNSVATAKSSQRLVVDIDTLRDVHEQVLKTLTDVRFEHEAGGQERKKAIEELEKLRNEMTREVQAIGFHSDN